MAASLQAVLAEAGTRTAFMAFCKGEHCEENAVLLLAIGDWDVAGAAVTARLPAANTIHKLVRTGVVNTSTKVKSAVEGGVSALRAAPDDAAAAPHIEALTLVFHTMRAAAEREVSAGVLPRFLASPAFAAAHAAAGAGGGSAGDGRRESVGATLMRSIGGSMRFRVGTGGAAGAADGLPPATPSRGGARSAAFTFAGPPAPSSTSSSPGLDAFALNLGGPTERRESLLHLLRHPVARRAFMEFCRSQHNDENADLLIDLHAFRDTAAAARGSANEKRKALARHLLDTYIRSGSPREANVDSRTRVLAEMYLSKAAATGTVPPDEDEDDGPAPGGIRSTPAPNALGKVETELLNMLSGEVVPRFATSRGWAECPANAACGTGAVGGAAARGDATIAAARGGVASAAVTGGSSGGGGGGTGGGITGWMKKMTTGGGGGSGGAGTPGSDAGSSVPPLPGGGDSAIASLRDKLYLFGVSLKPKLFSGSKKAELEALGADIRATALRSGYVFKRAHHKKSWKRRWFVLTPTVLGYFDAPTSTTPNGVILLSEMTRDMATEWDASFALGAGAASASPPLAGVAGGSSLDGVKPGSVEGLDEEGVPPDVTDLSYVMYLPTTHRTYTLQASSDKDRARWMYAVNRCRVGDSDAVRAAEAVGYSHIPTVSGLAAMRGTPSLRSLRLPPSIVSPADSTVIPAPAPAVTSSDAAAVVAGAPAGAGGPPSGAGGTAARVAAMRGGGAAVAAQSPAPAQPPAPLPSPSAAPSAPSTASGSRSRLSSHAEEGEGAGEEDDRWDTDSNPRGAGSRGASPHARARVEAGSSVGDGDREELEDDESASGEAGRRSGRPSAAPSIATAASDDDRW